MKGYTQAQQFVKSIEMMPTNSKHGIGYDCKSNKTNKTVFVKAEENQLSEKTENQLLSFKRKDNISEVSKTKETSKIKSLSSQKVGNLNVDEVIHQLSQTYLSDSSSSKPKRKNKRSKSNETKSAIYPISLKNEEVKLLKNPNTSLSDQNKGSHNVLIDPVKISKVH